MKKAAFHNLGCKVNSYELDAMMKRMAESGYEIVPFEERADVYIINTCSVTNIADRKSRQMLHRARKRNPDAVIVAVGCYVQTHSAELQEEEGIDLCIGNNLKGQIAEIIGEILLRKEAMEKAELGCEESPDAKKGVSTDGHAFALGNKDADSHAPERSNTGSASNELPLLHMIDVSQPVPYEDLSVSGTMERCRAFIKIQDGCNQFCSYCIIPYARGRVRSRGEESIIEEIRAMSQAGYQEFVLTGIHLSSYGTDFGQEKPRADRFGAEYLISLFRRIHDLPGVKRIRLGSLEPRIITEEFLQAIAGLPKICPHFHLSLQSGCNATLQRMNRHYTAEEFQEKVRLIRAYYEHPAITTDVIVGFPGEDEREFEECRRFLEDIRFYEMHIFKYSKRKNTPAAAMPGQLTEAQKAARSDALEEMERKHSADFRAYYIGKSVDVLFEEKKEIDGKVYWVGHTPEYVLAAVEAVSADLVNQILPVRIVDLKNDIFALGRFE